MAESLLDQSNVKILVANEIHKQRAAFYEHVYPETKMIVGDIKEKETFNRIISDSKKAVCDTMKAINTLAGDTTTCDVSNCD